MNPEAVVRILTVVLWCLGIVFTPIMLICSLNTLFGTGIDYTFGTWCAALFLIAVLDQNVGKK
jgi:hypothetical protein